MRKLPGWLQKTAILGFWLLAWQLLSLAVHNRILLVGPYETLRTLCLQLRALSFWKAVCFSAGRIGLGFFAAFGAGLLTGALSFRFTAFESFWAPLIQAMKSVPVACFVILALIWTGAANLSIFISFLVVYPAIHASTLEGLKSADPLLLETARVFRVPLPRKAFFIYRVSLYPYLAGACKSAVGMAFKSGIAAEVIGVPDGSIGEGLYQAKLYLSTAELFSWTLAIILVSAAFEKLFLLLLKALGREGSPLPFAAAHENRRAVKSVSAAPSCGQHSGCADFSEPPDFSPSSSHIILSRVTKYYGKNPVFSDVSHTFEGGRIYCVTAPSGAGKTTLFKMIMGLERPDAGSVSAISADGVSRARIGAVFQEDRLLTGTTAAENIRFVTGKRFCAEELNGYLLRLLPADSLSKPVSEFSGGMKRRLSILRALLAPSDILLMDEPFSGLDTETKQNAVRLIRELQNGRLLLLSTHSPGDAALLEAEIFRLPAPVYFP